MDDLLAELRALRAEVAALSRRELGFHTFEPRARFVYVKHDPGSSLWYFWDHDTNAKEVITHNALTGYLSNVSVFDKLDRDGPKPKLQVNIDADARYVLQCGLDTTFATGLLQSLAALSPADLARPITLQVAGNDVSAHRPVVFCTLYQDGKRIWFEDSGNDNAQLVAALRRRFRFPEPRGEGGASEGHEDETELSGSGRSGTSRQPEPDERATDGGVSEARVLGVTDFPLPVSPPFGDPEKWQPAGAKASWGAAPRELADLKSEVAGVAKRLARVGPEKRRDFFAWLSVVAEPYTRAAGVTALRGSPQGAVKDFEAEQFEAILGHLGNFGEWGFILDEAALREWEERFAGLQH